MFHQHVTRMGIREIGQAVLGSLGCAFVVSTGLSAASFDHSAWDRILKTYVSDLREVDYAALKRDRGELDNYIQMLGESSLINRPELLRSKAHELAYLMNAYNAFVVRGVIEKCPTRSVRDLEALYGFFRRKDYTAGGARVSLLYLENEIIRKRYREARIHFGIVCASIVARDSREMRLQGII